MKWLASSYQVRGYSNLGFFRRNPRRLKLGGNTLGVNFGANIAKYLGSNTGIAILDLSDGNLGSKATTSVKHQTHARNVSAVAYPRRYVKF